MTDHTAAQVAAIFGCSKRKVTDEATRHGVGYNLGGRGGYRFTDADVEKLRKAMAPVVAPERRRSA
jgi:hypothetical protein